jgi:hypothetical protein
MPTTRSNRNSTANTRPRESRGEQVESPREITNDVMNYLVDYARQNPGYAALCCLGVGFVLGWKLKPW